MKLIMLVGPPGSGKSTYAEKYVRMGYVRVSQDEQGRDGHREVFNKALENNENIIIDRMNFDKEQRNRYLLPAKLKKYETEIVVFYENHETCLFRCLERKNHPTITNSKSAGDALNTFFSKYEKVTTDEADVITKSYPHGPKPEVIWCDIDGTIANIDHRLHFIKNESKKNWKEFFNTMSDDVPYDYCKELITTMRIKYPIIFCSGRPDTYKNLTEDWLYKYELYRPSCDNLFMRRRHDFRPDSITKEIILDFEVLTRYRVKFCLDDRDAVVEMLRNRGQRVLQVAKGDF